MIKRFISFAVAAVLLSSASAAIAAKDNVVTAENPVELTPTKDWTFTQRPQSCVVSREFGQPGSKVLLQLENYTLDDGYRISLLTDDFKTTKKSPWVAFTPNGTLKEQQFALIANLTDGRTILEFDGSAGLGVMFDEEPDYEDPAVRARLKADNLEREKHIDKLVVAKAYDRDIVLDTGSMRAPMVIMRMCTDQLATRLGLDPSAMKTIVEPARPVDMQTWARQIQQNYPSKMIRMNKQASLPLRLTIDTAGRVQDCFVLDQSQPEDFIKTACRITKATAFEPAHDAEGHAIASIYSTRITYITTQTFKHIPGF